MQRTPSPSPPPPPPRTEWPSLNPHFLSLLRHISNLTYPARQPLPLRMQLLLEHTEEMCTHPNIELANHPDMHIIKNFPISNSYAKVPVAGKILVALYYRARCQSTILKLFMVLYESGFLDLSCLAVPVDLVDQSWLSDEPLRCEEMYRLWDHLNSYSSIREEVCHADGSRDYEERPYELWDLRASADPLEWLCVMIVRGTKTENARAVTECIESSDLMGELGPYADRHVGYSKRADNRRFDPLVRQPLEGACEEVVNTYFGFWLPHGLGERTEKEMLDALKMREELFRSTERCFRDFFYDGSAIWNTPW